MALCVALVALLAAVGAFGYLPHDAGPKEHFITDALLREVVDRMGKDLADASDSYLDFTGPESRLSLMARANKDELESEQFDYDSLTDGNPNPSLRDQEYLQHSSLWGQYLNGVSDDNQNIHSGGINRPVAPLKADATLPAYCNPPNPCPVGYTKEHGCITNFENTAAFSREYQSEQDCMCDGEHMFECPGGANNGNSGASRPDSSSLDRFLAQHLQINEHKNLVAKKYHVKKSQNPYLSGEKLPVAAKKGTNVDMDMK